MCAQKKCRHFNQNDSQKEKTIRYSFQMVISSVCSYLRKFTPLKEIQLQFNGYCKHFMNAKYKALNDT